MQRAAATTTTTTTGPAAPVQSLAAAGKGRSLWATAMARFRRNRAAVAGLVVVILMIAVAVFAPLLSLHDPTVIYYRHKLEAPNQFFPLGTDSLGRDMYSRLLYGARVSLPTGLVAVGIALVFGIPMGLAAGYFGRWMDTAVMRMCDVILAFPGILFAIWLVSIFGSSLRNVMISVGLFSVPGFARLIRSSVLTVKELDYITAERAIGASTGRIIGRHILPNVVQPLIVLSSLRVASAMLAAAGLSFLGLGTQPPTPEWGAMLSEGRAYIGIAWWVVFFPGFAISITVLAVNMVGDGLRDALDPRMRTT